HGNRFVLVYQGQYRNASIAYIDTRGFTGTVTASSQRFGIQYYSAETLNLLLGSGNDVLNVQGDGAVTNIATGPGDDSVFVSSDAASTVGGLQGELHGSLSA